MTGRPAPSRTTPTKHKKASEASPPKSPINLRSPERRNISPAKRAVTTSSLTTAPGPSRSTSPNRQEMRRGAALITSTASAKARSPSPTKMTGLNHATTSSVKDLATKEVWITNILGCIQKSLHEDKFAEQRNITLVPIKSDDTTQMLENAEIVISEPKLIAPYLKKFKSLKWFQSTWAGVDAIFRQLKLDREEHEGQQREYKKFQEAIEVQRQALEAQKHELMAQLGGVEKALAQARVQVRGMTKQHLEELRSMNNPPAIVKSCLEAVAMLIVPNESQPMSWDNIRKLTRRDDFIQNVSDFDGIKQSFPVGAITTIKSQYLSQPNFTQKAVEYASRACGPLMGWLDAQIQFGEVMSQNAPLINKLKELQAAYESLVAKCDSIPTPPILPSVPTYQITRLGGIKRLLSEEEGEGGGM